jgi:hypothetical protein
VSEPAQLLAGFCLPRPDRSPIHEWARRHITLPESYATPGPFNARVTPWLVPIFEALQNPLVRRVHFRKAVQIGGTLVADIWIPWVIVNDAGPIMWTMQTDEMMERHCKSRLNPLLERCKPVASMLPRPGPQRTTTEIYFGGFFLVCNAANLSSQQSQSIRYRVLDEIWLPRWQEIYGHAVARVSKFEEVGRSKIYSMSQAPLMDEITGNVEDAAFRQGNQQEWSAECPACKKVHPVAFDIRDEKGTVIGGCVWDRTAKRDDESWDVARVVATVRFRCPHCGHESEDSDTTRVAWKRTGRYVPLNPSAPHEMVSFRVEALVSRPMRLLAEEWAQAENALVKSGNDQAKIEFRTKREAKPWLVEKRTLSVFVAKSGYKVATYAQGDLIADEQMRIMAIDRQLDHWWVEIGAFSPGPHYRQLYFGRVETRDQLRSLQARYRVPNHCVAQDRGYKPSEVDRDCVDFGWRGMRGFGRKTWTMKDESTNQMVNFPYSDPQVSDYRGGDAYFYNWSGDHFKDMLSLALECKGDLKWSMPEDVNPLYLEHLRGEHKVEVRAGVWEWREVKSNAPNHGFDTSAMMLCIATIAGIVRYKPPEAIKL